MLACQIGGCKSSLDTGSIVLIVIGSIILVLALIFVITKLSKRK